MEARLPRDGSARPVLAVARELVIVGFAAAVYGGVRAITERSTAAAIDNAKTIARIEDALGIAWERAAQSAVLGSDALVTLANWVYIFGHWPVIVTAAVFLYLRRPDRYRLLRNAMIVSGLIGFAFFAALPVAPPRLANLGLVDTVAERSHAYRALQPPSLTNQYAALPSLHFGWNLLVGIILFTTFASLAVRAFAVLMPVAMAFSVVATANHFVLDVALGTAVVLVGLAVAVDLERRGRQARLDATLRRSESPRWGRRRPPAGVTLRRRAPRGQQPRSSP